MKMEWTPMRGRIQITPKGTPRAFLYYYVVREGAYRYRAGRYWFNREVDFTFNGSPVVFPTSKLAREFCELHDEKTLVIEAVTA